MNTTESVTVSVKSHPVIIDKDFAEDFDPKLWFIYFKKGQPFAVKAFARVIGKRPHRNNITASLHRVVALAKDGDIVDHINRNPLDNRRCNLRIVPSGVNRQNAKVNCNSKSGLKGVHYVKAMHRSKPWRVWGSLGAGTKKRRHLGYFATKEEAAMAYNNWTRKVFGPNAALNPI